MRIAFIFTKTTPGWDDRTLATGLGGTEAAMVLYSREFARRGHDVWCFVPQCEDGIYNGVVWRGSLDRYSQDEWDVAISCRFPDDLGGIRAPVRALFANDQTCPTLPEAVFRGWCNQIITLSKHQTELYQSLYTNVPKELYLTSSAGVDVMPERIPHEGLHCFYSSTPERGLERLLRLWPAITDGIGAELWITSGFQLYGWDQATCDKHSKHIYDKVGEAHYVGPLKRKDYLDLLSKMDLMTYPSIYAENCCISALEAQATGLPIVTCPMGALGERVIDGVNGYLATSDDEFVACTRHLLQNERERQKMGAAGKKMAEGHRYPVLCQQWEERWEQISRQREK
jgi:hypothetical protein